LLKTYRFGLPQVTNGAPAQTFPVVQEGTYFALEYAGSRFARLNKHFCRILNALIADKQVSFTAAVHGTEWKAVLNSSHDQGQCVLSFEVQIYGAKLDAEEVGRILSRSNTYLQFPQLGCNAGYYNPHLFRIDGYSDQIPLEALKENGILQAEIQNLTSNEDPKVSDSAVVDSILDSLEHNVDVGTISVDRRIKSTLLPHQMKAIDFISRREMGQLVSNLSLWRYNDVDANEPFYQHIFTGAKRTQRNEEKGGIIADEMGLGKSLVILSTIAGSLDRSESFVNAETQTHAAYYARMIRTRATLIVAPSSLLIDSWVDEIRKHTFTGALSFHRHLGFGRHAETDQLQTRMIVFTTYATVAAEFCRGNSSLSQRHWFRIVLDEAHDIRNRSTKQFQAVSSLSAEHRWCLTGTPIQNSLDDLGALTTFLKVPILEHAPTFRKFISTPITSGSKGRFQNLQLLLQTVCLRRTRELLNLPEPIPKIRRLSLAPHEQTEYKDLLCRCRVDIDMAVSGQRKGKINSTVLESLLKLRLYCNNGLVASTTNVHGSGLPTDPDEALAYLQQIDRNICAYCSATIYSLNDAAGADGAALLRSCQHLVCRTCMPHHRAQKQQCPACIAGEELPLPSNSIVSTQAQQPGVTPCRTSFPTKLQALLADISRDTSHKRYEANTHRNISRTNIHAKHRIFLLEENSHPHERTAFLSRDPIRYDRRLTYPHGKTEGLEGLPIAFGRKRTHDDTWDWGCWAKSCGGVARLPFRAAMESFDRVAGYRTSFATRSDSSSSHRSIHIEGYD
jgi:SWI/SNF-related matrix-associated actin-dependent regulator of chromatin subfamily A3